MTADISAMVKDVTYSAPGATSPGLQGISQDLPSWVLSRVAGNQEAEAAARTWLAAAAMRIPELCFGLTYAMVATQLILAHMVRRKVTCFYAWGAEFASLWPVQLGRYTLRLQDEFSKVQAVPISLRVLPTCSQQFS
jgi:hypothetical protein